MDNTTIIQRLKGKQFICNHPEVGIAAAIHFSKMNENEGKHCCVKTCKIRNAIHGNPDKHVYTNSLLKVN